jgi:hypothetical protein
MDKSYYLQIQNAESRMFIECGEIMGDKLIIKPITKGENSRSIIGFTINPNNPIPGYILKDASNSNKIIRDALLVARYFPKRFIDEIKTEVRNPENSIDKAYEYTFAVPHDKYLIINWDKLKIRPTVFMHLRDYMVGVLFKDIFKVNVATESPTLPTTDYNLKAYTGEDLETGADNDFDFSNVPEYKLFSSKDIGVGVRPETSVAESIGGKRKSKRTRSSKKSKKAKRKSHKKK